GAEHLATRVVEITAYSDIGGPPQHHEGRAVRTRGRPWTVAGAAARAPPGAPRGRRARPPPRARPPCARAPPRAPPAGRGTRPAVWGGASGNAARSSSGS